MKRYLFMTFSLLLLMSMSSFATDTRVLTMGDNNTILLDDANIWQFPSRVNDYPNLAIGEFGYPGFTKFGIHWKFNEDNPWVLGTYLHNSSVVSPMNSMFRSYYGAPYGYAYQFIPFDWSLMSNQRFDLLYGRLLGANQIPFGFLFTLVQSSQRNDVADNKDEEGYASYNLALGLTLGGGTTDIAGGVQFLTWTDKTTAADSTVWDETKPKGNMSLYGQIRHFWVPGPPPYTVIPHASFVYGKNEAEYYSDDTTLAEDDKYTSFSFEAGMGLQYAPSSDAMAVIDFGIRYQKTDGDFHDLSPVDTTVTASKKNLTVPYFRAGLDAKVFDWMDLRLGATSYWDRTTRENDSPSKFIQNYANNATYLGFGFHWGNLTIDTYTDPNLFLKGFNFISGETNSMNFQFSALYEIM